MRRKKRRNETELLPPPRVNYRALIRHEEPERAREPPEALICRERPECVGCPYPAHGFVCLLSDCVRKQMESIQGRQNRLRIKIHKNTTDLVLIEAENAPNAFLIRCLMPIECELPQKP